ncbi:threonine--tRNA ligase [Acidobacteria bacterium AH-259-O06]|nr:threonine--tRNA ligase [Acidobacteria bacterium AH-259-O06]
MSEPGRLRAIRKDGTVFEVEDREEALEILRHSTSHLMALAVTELYPRVHLGIGPPTSQGFYYDFRTPHQFSEEDLEKIEKKMEEFKGQNLSFEPSIVGKEEALEFFRTKGEDLKTELIEERDGQVLSYYKLGNLVDFCTGPHVVSTSDLGAFKLLSIAGSYWKGDEHREQLQRIYGTAFFEEEELHDHLEKLEEARKRDHRRLGKDLGLFWVQDEVAPGLIFWLPKGAKVRAVMEEFLRGELEARGYQFVYSPHIAKSDLWKTSGHYEYFRHHMYILPVDEEEYVLKPMNCPGHILIYKSAKRSYRELPIRIAEFGTVYRYEKSGTLHGMLRVRGFTQDDAHIFCRPDQVLDEVVETLDLAEHILKSFGFDRYEITLSVWDPAHPENYAGKPEDWKSAEVVLIQALERKGWAYERCQGDAAFYGPKIDVELIDELGRPWQLSTFQFDFSLPERFRVAYVGADSKEHLVVMIHRALLGSLERFMGVLIEHYAGAFPIWLAPTQAVVIAVSARHHQYALQVEKELKNHSTGQIRVETDLRNEKMGYKIREAQLQKVPYMLIVGDREIEDQTIAVRNRFKGDQGAMTIEGFANMIRDLIDKKAVRP